MDTPVSVMEQAGEGGAWGIALLAAYRKNKQDGESLADYLKAKVFPKAGSVTEQPLPADVAGFDVFMKRYHAGLSVERAAIDAVK